MSTGGSVDERIRAVLDLGDSSGAVKALDAEVQKLLEDFKKQTELFEQKKLAPQQYADAVAKLKSEVGGLSGAIKDLGGGGGGGNLDAVTSKIFALERGLSSLASGSGLGRAGGLLESGLSLLGGPAGIGALVASIAYTLDQVAPKIKASWDNLWKQFSEEQVQAKLSELKASGTAMKAEVDAFFTRPVPGTEGMEAERQKKLTTLFNVGTGTGDKSLRLGLLRAMSQAQGGAPAALSGEEKQELDTITKKLFPARSEEEIQAQQGTFGGILFGLGEIAQLPEIWWKGDDVHKQQLTLRMKVILEDAAKRSVSDLLLKLQQGGQPGVQAAEQLKDLIGRFPQLFNADMKTQLDDVLKLGKQIQLEAGGGPGIGRAQAVYRVPTATDLQREQEIEGLEGGRIGGRRRLEQQDRQMFMRNAMQELMEANPQLKMSDPQQRALLEHEAQARWQMMMGGPHDRREQEQMERDAARRGRTAELIGEHPELTFQEAETQARRETQRRERALYPERFRRRPGQRRAVGQVQARQRAAAERRRQAGAQDLKEVPLPGTSEFEEWSRRASREQPRPSPAVPTPPAPMIPPPPSPEVPGAFVGPPALPHAALPGPAAALPAGRDPRIAEYAAKIAEREAMKQRMAGLDAAARQAASEEREASGGGETMEQFYARSIEALGQKQSQAMGLEKQGLANHAKTQAIVADLQRQIEENPDRDHADRPQCRQPAPNAAEKSTEHHGQSLMSQDYLTINGTQINMAAWDVALDRCTPWVRGGIPELSFSRLVGKLAALPDSWSGKTCSWSNGASYPGTTYFTGTVVGYTDRFDHDFGWVRDYRALGLRNLADYVPVTDSNTLSDAAQFNMPSNTIQSIPARMGRTCGQAVLDILSMHQNATALQAYGIGNYMTTGSGATASSNMATGNTLATYGTITSLNVVNGGSGYGTTAPTVVVVGPCTTQAVFTANLTAGSVTSFTQVNAGAGYITPPTVIISTLPAATISDLRGAYRHQPICPDVLR